MDQNTDKKVEFIDKLKLFLIAQKIKIILFLSILVLFLIIFSIMKINQERQNILMSEKFIKANVYLSSGNKEKSKEIYEEIIKSENKFYSILALNGIIENNLENNQDTILEYFASIENLNHVQENLDLLKFKKALFLLKNLQNKKGNELLQDLIDNNSNLKSLASEIINK